MVFSGLMWPGQVVRPLWMAQAAAWASGTVSVLSAYEGEASRKHRATSLPTECRRAGHCEAPDPRTYLPGHNHTEEILPGALIYMLLSMGVTWDMLNSLS